jgi:SAM-dependent methyltransferase
MIDDRFFSGLLRRRDSAFSADLLIAAIGYVDFFNWLKNNPSSPEEICASLHLAERPVDVMLTFFCSIGLIKQAGKKYRVSRNGCTYFIRGSKYDMTGYFHSLRERPICRDIVSVLRTGAPLNWAGAPDKDEWARAMANEEFAEDFTSAMDSRGAVLAPILAGKISCRKYTSLLDVAGASGIYSCALVKANPRLRATVLEKPPVDVCARKAILKEGLSNKISVLAADMFSDPWPGGFDMHLLSHVLHDWDGQDVRYLLKQSFNTLKPGGLLAIHDAHVNKSKTGPVEVAEYSILLMLSTRGKCYSIKEMEGWLKEVGFTGFRITPTAGYRSILTARKPG